MIVYRTTVTKDDKVIAQFHSDDLTEANDKAHAVAESGAVVTITTVVQAVDGEWEDTSEDNLVLRYLYATPNDISYWGS
tara:strand:- start:6445 stop:6681 length:237 start_codon:yes stop_codon:yes gene_type:complete